MGINTEIKKLQDALEASDNPGEEGEIIAKIENLVYEDIEELYNERNKLFTEIDKLDKKIFSLKKKYRLFRVPS